MPESPSLAPATAVPDSANDRRVLEPTTFLEVFPSEFRETCHEASLPIWPESRAVVPGGSGTIPVETNTQTFAQTSLIPDSCFKDNYGSSARLLMAEFSQTQMALIFHTSPEPTFAVSSDDKWHFPNTFTW